MSTKFNLTTHVEVKNLDVGTWFVQDVTGYVGLVVRDIDDRKRVVFFEDDGPVVYGDVGSYLAGSVVHDEVLIVCEDLL